MSSESGSKAAADTSRGRSKRGAGTFWRRPPREPRASPKRQRGGSPSSPGRRVRDLHATVYFNQRGSRGADSRQPRTGAAAGRARVQPARRDPPCSGSDRPGCHGARPGAWPRRGVASRARSQPRPPNSITRGSGPTRRAVRPPRRSSSRWIASSHGASRAGGETATIARRSSSGSSRPSANGTANGLSSSACASRLAPNSSKGLA